MCPKLIDKIFTQGKSSYVYVFHIQLPYECLSSEDLLSRDDFDRTNFPVIGRIPSCSSSTSNENWALWNIIFDAHVKYAKGESESMFFTVFQNRLSGETFDRRARSLRQDEGKTVHFLNIWDANLKLCDGSIQLMQSRNGSYQVKRLQKGSRLIHSYRKVSQYEVTFLTWRK